MGRGCKECLGINLKTRKILIIRLELDLESGMSVVFVAEELKKRKVDICGLQKVRLRGQGARFIGVKKDTSYGGRKIMLESFVDIYKEGVKE